MSDSFNPHEILSRLRAKPVGAHQNVPSNGTINQPMNNAAPPHPTVAPVGGMNSSFNTNNLHASASGSNLGNLTPSKTINTSKTIKAPATLTLTPAQRQDNLTMRNELEKEVKRLQDEIQSLKNENKQLKEDKEDVERQFIDFKLKHDSIVTKLRGKIAELSLSQQKPSYSTVNDASGKMYPPNPSFTSPKLAKGNTMQQFNHQYHQNPHMMPPPAPVVDEGFREPTFSELMRRSSMDPPDFKDSLRRSGINGSNTKNGNNKLNNTPQPTTMQQRINGGEFYNSYPDAAAVLTNNHFLDHYEGYGSPRMPTSSGYGLNSPMPGNNTAGNPLNNSGLNNTSTNNNMSGNNSINNNNHNNHNNNSMNNSNNSGNNGNNGNNNNGNNNSNNSVNNSKKPLHRAMSFFDSTFMKGNNVNPTNTSSNNVYDPTSTGGSMMNDNNNTNSGAGDYPSLRHHGSMYSLMNNYPGYGNNGNEYESSGLGGQGGGGLSRKMSLPESAYADITNDLQVVEIDLTN